MVVWFSEIKEERSAKHNQKEIMLLEESFSGILGLLLWASVPRGTIVLIQGLAKVDELVGGGEEGKAWIVYCSGSS